MKQKRVVAIHDISCFGKCSLTVALPIISAVGVETTVIPTAILSTHTGGFQNFTFHDLTNEIMPIAKHWQNYDINFDGIYTGYLGSKEQIGLISEFFDMYKKENTLILVDPVMADNGVLYGAFSSDFPQEMKKLCEKADIIVPNITEACFMLNEKYIEGPYTKGYIEMLLKKLSDLGPKKVVLTGVFFDNERLGAACYDDSSKEVEYVFDSKIDGYYHGTGDVFGSSLLAAIMKGKSLKEATAIAVDFTVESIKRTYEAKTDIRFGVDFENGLEKLINQCK